MNKQSLMNIMLFLAVLLMNESNASTENSDKQQETKASSETIIQDKPIKKTSRLAVFSIASGLLGFYCCLLVLGVGTGWPEIASPIVGILLFAAPVLGTIILYVLARKNKSKILNTIIAILIIIFLLNIFLPSWYKVRECGKVIQCGSNLKQLGIVIAKYTEAHDGYLPAANQWCDLLIEYAKSLSKDNFKCPAVKHRICNYAFNKNLDGLRLSDVPGDVVLLYEADGRWNDTGGVELLTIKNHSRQICNVLSTDGDVKRYYPEQLIKQLLRWKP